MVPKLAKEPLMKLFTPSEHKYCLSHNDPAPYYAARWCAKEALLKAISPFCRLSLRDIEITRLKDGTPSFSLLTKRRIDVDIEAKLSIAHSDTSAVAVALVFVTKKTQVSEGTMAKRKFPGKGL